MVKGHCRLDSSIDMDIGVFCPPLHAQALAVQRRLRPNPHKPCLLCDIYKRLSDWAETVAPSCTDLAV